MRRLRPRIDEADKVDLVTRDLLIEIVRELEKARWMWQAQSLGSAGGDATGCVGDLAHRQGESS